MSKKKDLTSNVGSSKLHNNGANSGSLINSSFNNLSEKQTKKLLGKAAEERSRLEAKQIEQNLDYEQGLQATRDHIDAFEMLDKTGNLTRQTITSDIKTGAGNMRIESKSGATCFVASAAYDNPNHPDVMFLRWYRDTILNNSYLGKFFITIYWSIGALLPKPVKNNQTTRNFARKMISSLVRNLKEKHANNS